MSAWLDILAQRLAQKASVVVVGIMVSVNGALIPTRVIPVAPQAPTFSDVMAAMTSTTIQITPPTTSSPATITVTAPVVKAPSVSVVPPPTTIATPSVAPKNVTAQWLLDNTKLSFKERRTGPYEVLFSANVGGTKLSWGVADTFIGGSEGIPKFNFSFSCDPIAEQPLPDDIDQTPFFKVQSHYHCTMGLGATSGSDQRTQYKDTLFVTSPGQFIVTPPSSMNTVLTNDLNNGGFVFNNQDVSPVAVTKLVFDISYTALSTIELPLILRIVDPVSNTSLADYHMENIPIDAGSSYTHTVTNIEIPISFVVPPMSQKILPIQVLGVHWMSISGIDPNVSIVLKGIKTERTDMPIILNAAQVVWKCVVALSGYDPNATDSPFATGEVCK